MSSRRGTEELLSLPPPLGSRPDNAWVLLPLTMQPSPGAVPLGLQRHSVLLLCFQDRVVSASSRR